MSGRLNLRFSDLRWPRKLTAIGAGALLAAGGLVAATAVTTTVAANAAVGDPFDCTSARFFLSQSAGNGPQNTTQLYQLIEGNNGQVTKSTIGPDAGPPYNALGYNPGNNYLYANFNVLDTQTGNGVPSLGRIDSTGTTTIVGPFQAATGTTDIPGGVSGTFDDNNRYWISGPGQSTLDRINLGTAKSGLHVTMANGVTLGGSDMTFADGYIWSVQDGGTQILRVDLNPDANGIVQTTLINISGFVADGGAQGGDWTYGNGNIGTSNNSTGKITQIHIDNPTSATPTASVVNNVVGPPSGGNDGASCAPSNVPVGITKTAPATVGVGGTVTWTITVHNFSADSGSSGYFFTDQVPSNVTNVSAVTGPGSCTSPVAGQSFTCNGGVLAAGGTDTFTFTGTAPSPGETITNTASVFANENNLCETGAGPAGCVTEASATTTTPVPMADLAITKTGPATIDANGLITWNLAVTNNGPDTSTGATVTDNVPAGVTDVAAPGCSVAGNAVTCAVGAQAKGDPPQQITVTGRAPADYSDCDITNVASVQGVLPEPPGDGANNSAQWNTCTNGPQLTVTKTATTADGTSNAQPGSVVHYTITVTNPGPGLYTAANPASFADDLSGVLDDASVDANSLSADEGTASISGNTLSWSGTPAITTPGDDHHVTITYSVTVKNPDTGDHDLGNAINSINGHDCSVEACPPPTHDFVPLLDVTKKATTDDGTSNAPPGTKVAYLITVHNGSANGDWTTTTPATFTDDLTGVLDDATVDAGSLSAGLGTPTISGNTLSWSGPLGHQATTTISYTVTVKNPDTGDHDLGNAINSINGHDCSVEACPPPTHDFVPLLDVTKKATTDDGTTNAPPGTNVTYTITVHNGSANGDWTTTTPATFTDDLTGVLDDATVDAGSLSAGLGTPTISGNTLSWSGPLGHQATTTISYTVTVNNPDTGDHDLGNVINSINGHDCSVEACPPPTHDFVPLLDVTKKATTDDGTTSAPPGTKVAYLITVHNGSANGDWTTTTPATFTDDLTGVLDDATVDAGSLSAGLGTPTISGNTLSWSGPLGHQATTTISYTVTVKNPDTGDHDLGNAINSINGHNCSVEACPPPTHDYVPDLHVEKTASTDNAAPGTTITYKITVANPSTLAGWTTDAPAMITDNMTNVLDDATYNNDATVTGTSVQAVYSAPYLTWSGPLAATASITITYSVTVHDPDTGDHIVDNAVVANGGNCLAGSTDPFCSAQPKVPDLTVSKHASTDNAAPGSTVTYTIDVKNSGQGDWTAAHPASLTDDLSDVLDDAAYNGDAVVTTTVPGGDAVAAPTYGAPVLVWSGPLVHGQSFTITYSVTIHLPDSGDHLMNNAVVAVTGNCAAGSTDPACKAPTTKIPDMAVTKTVSSTNSAPGSTVTYTIIVSNPGTGAWTPATPASLTDDLSDVLDDAAYNGDAVVNVTRPGQPVPPAPVYNAPNLTWSGPLASLDSFTITYSVTIKNPDTGDHALNNGVVAVSGPCVDPSNPDCQAPTTEIPDMAVTKTVSSTNSAPGSTVTYTVQVENSGQGDWTDSVPASLTDDLSDVLDDATYNNDAVVTTTVPGGDAVAAPTYAEPVLAWSGPLVHGQSFTITYSVTINNPDTGDHALNNGVVAVSGPCVDPSNPDCQAPTTEIPDMAVTKTVSSTNSAPGSTVTYTVQVENSGQGDWTDSVPASLTDDLSDVLDDATYNNDAVVTTTVPGGDAVAAPTYAEPVLAWSGPLVHGQSFTITYSVTINNPDTGDHALNNGVVAVSGPCVDPSNPDCQAPTTEIPDMAVTKVASTNDAAPGSVVDYTIMVSNPGAGDWTDAMPASFTDDLSDVLDDAAYNNDAVVTTTVPGGDAVAAPTYAEPVLAWSGPLVHGQSFTITYSATIENPDTGDHSIINTVVDPAGNCLAGSTDPTCTSTTLVPDLNVVKKASATTVGLRGKLGYTLTITNPGKGDWTDALPAAATDDLSDVLDDATYDKDAKASAGTVTVTGTTLTWSGPLATSDTVTVTYSVTVDDRDSGNHELNNHVSTPTGNCDPEPGNPDCNTTTPVAAYVLTKASDPKTGTKVKSGERVHYTVTVVNTGQVDLTPTVSDDLTKVLDDASYNHDAKTSAGRVTRSGNQLVWAVPLPIGATATLKYSVTVSDDAHGDHDLLNVATGDGPLATCGAGQSVCETDSPAPTAGSGVASTGAAHLPAELLISMLLLALGAGLVVVGRRRRARG